MTTNPKINTVQPDLPSNPPSSFGELDLKKFLKLKKESQIDSLSLIQHYINAVESDNERADKINAIVYFSEAKAKEQIKELKDSPDNPNSSRLLSGVPIVLKNNFNIEGFPTQCSSKILEGYISPYNGTVAKKILQQGGVVWGMSNMDEFAMGSSNETSWHGVVRNPINRDYIPGGSSGGSAAAVKAGQALVALGSDTGGSIRQPAACCGIVGLKPTYGRVSRYGLVAFASSFDQIGPLTRTVEDAALLLKVIAGYDEKDNTSVNIAVDDYPNLLGQPIKGKKIALPKEYFSDQVDGEVRQSIKEVISFYEKEGAILEEVSLPHTHHSIGVYYILSTAEASSNLARFDGVRYGLRNQETNNYNDLFLKTRSEGFGREVKRRILMGSYVLSSGYFDAYYLKALKVRNVIKNEYVSLLRKYDAILTPTTPYKIFKIGEKIEDPIAMYLSDLFTVSANVTGIPAISLPCGKDSNAMPISFQLMAAPFKESVILNLAHHYQSRNAIKFENKN